MARRRMFSLDVIDTDDFLELPLSAQALYFHLGMRADDDGFIKNARQTLRVVGANRDDMKLLITKGYVLEFDSGIMVITHWKISNYIQKDRYRPTLCREEKAQLFQLTDGRYSKVFAPGAKPCISPSEQIPESSHFPATTSGYNMYPECIPRLGKDRLGEDRLGQVSLGEVKYISGGGESCAGADKIRAYFQNRSFDTEQLLGTTEEIVSEVNEITHQIFGTFVGRQATAADTSLVFQYITDYRLNPDTGEWGRAIHKNRLNLLLYAFEHATKAGKLGNWNYINGVLRNLAERRITTLAEAEEYDDNI